MIDAVNRIANSSITRIIMRLGGRGNSRPSSGNSWLLVSSRFRLLLQDSAFADDKAGSVKPNCLRAS